MDAREKRLVEDCGGTLFLLLLTLFRFTRARSRSLRLVVVDSWPAEGLAASLSMTREVRWGGEGRKNGGRRKE